MFSLKRCVVGALALLVVAVGVADGALLTEGQLKKLRDSHPLFSQRSEYGAFDVAGRIQKLDTNGSFWGASALGDAVELGFGTGVGANPDMAFIYNGTGDTLTLSQKVDGTGKLVFGAAGTNGMDIDILSKTADDKITWDAGDKRLTFEDSTLLMGLDDRIFFGDTDVFIESDDDGYLDLDANTGIRFNGSTAVSGANTFATGTGAVGLNGDVTVAAGKDISLAKGTGYIEINANTSGILKILPTAATAQTVTLGTVGQTVGAGTINIPDLAGNTVNILATDLYKTKWTFMIPGAVGEDTDGVLTNAGGVAGGSGATGVTQTEATAAFAVVDDGGVMGTLLANSYKLFPATPAAGDALYLGAAIPFCEFGIDMSATVAVYDEPAVLAWQYSKGAAAWGALTLRDATGASAETGAYFGERDGAVSFVPPADWAADEINGQSAYWIRAVIQADKADNMTTVGVTASKEHLIVTPDGDGFTVPFKCNISKVRVTTTGVVHNQIVRFVLVNFTKGTYSLELSWAASQVTDTFTGTALKAASAGVDCDAGDVLGILVTEDNGATVNPTNIVVELDVTMKD